MACPSVSVSSALWKNGRSDPHAIWHHRSDWSCNEAGGGVWGSVDGKGYFWVRIWGAPLYPMGTLQRSCATVPQPSELQFGVVCAVGRGTPVLDGGEHCPRGRRGFGGFWVNLSDNTVPGNWHLCKLETTATDVGKPKNTYIFTGNVVGSGYSAGVVYIVSAKFAWHIQPFNIH